MADFNINEFKSTSVDKSLAKSITSSGSVTAESVTASGTVSANTLNASSITANGGTLSVGDITSSTDTIKSNKILPRDGLDFEVGSTNRLITSNSNSSIFISLDSGAANTRDSLRLHHIRGNEDPNAGSYIDYRDDKPLSIRAQDTNNTTSGQFFIKKGYSAGAPGTVIKHSIYNGNQIPNSWITVGGGGNQRRWNDSNNPAGGPAQGVYHSPTQWNNLPGFLRGTTTYKIICGFYYLGLATEFNNIAKRIIVKFSGAHRIDGAGSDEYRSLLGFYFPSLTPSGITSVENSLLTVLWRGGSGAGGGARGSSLFPVSGYVDLPPVSAGQYPYFCLGISKYSTNDDIMLWDYHSTVEIIETVAP